MTTSIVYHLLKQNVQPGTGNPIVDLFGNRPVTPPQRARDSGDPNRGIAKHMKGTVGQEPSSARFEALCQSLRPDLLRYAFWLSRDRALAEDVVQEAMVRAWKARDALLNDAAVKPWFQTIIRREYARTFEGKRLVTVDLDDLISREEPTLAAEDNDDLIELRAALFKLPDEYRVPLVLQVLMGYSTAEIARELEMSQPAVLTRLFRARKRLLRLCGEDDGSADGEE